jgi:peptidoglycan/xylan/chitin deacetylase (PgdA/CDA1 family)
MYRCILALALVLPLSLVGCKKASTQGTQNDKPAEAPASPAVSSTPTPAAVATPAPSPAIDRSARVVVLCYHRFEDRPKDQLAIAPAEFKTQMQQLKDAGIQVVAMKDFLAWRRGEKSIAPKSAVITIDDGYVSGYNVAWPILKQFGYPFTMFIYTNYINVGGKSISWAQLEEMRDAGVDIESHTVSHKDLRRAPKGQEYNAWLHNELFASKQLLEDKLGIKIVALAFPYGTYNENVRKASQAAGYEAAFTVYGQHMGIDAPADLLGRYAVESMHPNIFKSAIEFNSSEGNQPGVESEQLAVASMITEPMNEERVANTRPTIKANLASMGAVESGSVEMRISGYGVVPATYDAQTKLVSYVFTQNLMPRSYTVILSAKVNGRRVETRWNFTIDPTADGKQAAAKGT